MELPKATYDSPDYIQVPVRDILRSSPIDGPPEEKVTRFKLVEYRKVKFELRELNGRFIENGYKYILNESNQLSGESRQC